MNLFVCLTVIGNDGGGGKEMVCSSGGRSFQKRGRGEIQGKLQIPLIF